MTKDNIIVSVCMITYNHESYITQAIEGVLMQKCNFPIELVIGEDCSTDCTRAICKEYAINQKEIRLLPSDCNIGVMANFIKTLEACTGKYIAICEGDDYWTDPYKLQKQVDFLENNEDYGLVYTEFDSLCQATGVIEKSQFKNKLGIKQNNFEDFLRNGWFLAPCTWMFRSISLELTYEYSDKGFLAGDLQLLLTIAANSKIGYIDEVTSVYRVLSESASHTLSFEKKERFLLSVLHLQLHYLEKFGIESITEEELKQKQYYAIMNSAVAMGNFLKAKEYANQLNLNSFRIALNYCATRNIITFKIYIEIIHLRHIFDK